MQEVSVVVEKPVMNTEGEQSNPIKKWDLIPLMPEQHAVTSVPKFTTELPFFYLTKQKQLLEKDIQYKGVDTFGNPIAWEVIPNRSPKIGVPGIEAHEIWTRLVKPAIDAQRTPQGEVPEIVPLGGIRECLRIIGWREGGWTARGLIQGLMQVGQASCSTDFLLPVRSDSLASVRFRAIKGVFNRFSIWKIGSKHLTEEELATGNLQFDFDLDDTVYLQLHTLERQIQTDQGQRYLDNQYMFSVEARARRWYELMHAKIFAVTKNGGSYCDVGYSWYVHHHHTLQRLQTRARVVSQMNRIVRDHKASGFIERVEYLPIKEPGKEIDFLVRYYPGPSSERIH